jgi:flagellar biosynthesis/type III secretory pathway ATPase
LERSGQGEQGSITAIYTVLVEGDELDEPIADEVRGVLDGHIVLSRQLAERGHYPAVEVGASLSRVMDRVTSPEQVRAARSFRGLIAAHEGKRDLLAMGAYAKGSDPLVDQALQRWPQVLGFLQQDPRLQVPLADTVQQLESLVRDVRL